MTQPSSTGAAEAKLRAALADLRPADGAPPALRARVDAVPARLGATGPLGALRRVVASPASMAVLVSAAAIALVAFSLAKVGVPPSPGSGSPTPAPFDPTAEGAGIGRFAFPMLQLVWAAALVLAIILAARWRSAIRLERGSDFARGAVLILLVGAPSALVLEPPLRDYGGSCCTSVGFGPRVDPAPGTEGPEVDYVNAAPGEPFIAYVEITNGSALPVTLDGIVTNEAPGSSGPRWIALALATEPNVFANEIGKLRTFAPQVIPPNERITVYLVGKAGPCAFGPDFSLDSFGVGDYAALDRDLQLAYSVLGVPATSTFTMPFQVVAPTRDFCS